MAKQGQHRDDETDRAKSRGHNNPDKSVTITTGSVKKQETYEKQAAEHEATNRPAQAAKNEWHEQTPTETSRRDREGAGRTGSDSMRTPWSTCTGRGTC